jgi:hypothetical protein
MKGGIMSKDALAKRAANTAVTRMQEECNSVGLTLTVLAGKLKEALDATEIKTAYDSVLCKWQYSDPLVDHGPRLRAVEISCKLLGAYPSEKYDHVHNIAPNLEERLRRALDGKISYRQAVQTVRPELAEDSNPAKRH